ncbi:unnamed protein product [Caenorhabditis brenneri]
MLPHLKHQKNVATPKSAHIPSYRKYGYERLRYVLNFEPSETAHFTLAPTNKTDLDISEAAFRRNKTRMNKMTAKLVRIQSLQTEEIELYSGQAMDNRMRNGVLKIKEIIDNSLPPHEIPFYSEEFGRIDILIQNWEQERTRNQEQNFRTAKISYAGYLRELRKYKAEYFSHLSKYYQKVVLKRIAMAEMKIEMFNTWLAIETCKLVVEGLRYLRQKFQQNVWEIILQKPIHRLRNATITPLDQIEIVRVCGLFAPGYRFVSYGNSAFNSQNFTLGYPIAQNYVQNRSNTMENSSQMNGAFMMFNRTIKEEPDLDPNTFPFCNMNINDSHEALLQFQRYFQAK